MFLSTLMLCVMTLPLILACGNDTDEDSTPTSADVLDKNNGLRVMKVGDVTYYYTDKGQIDYLLDGIYDRYDFSDTPNRIIYTTEGDEKHILSLLYNSAGYITNVSSTGNGSDSEGSWSLNANTSISYDNNGHIIETSGSGKESGTNQDGSTFSEKWSVKYIFTWNNNILIQVDRTERIERNGNTENETETWIYTYADHLNKNVYCQWTPSFKHAFGSDIVFSYIGLCGKGPSSLPISAKQHYDNYFDGKSHITDKSYTYRYGFNNDGSVSYNYVNSTRYDFSYESNDTDDKVVDSTPYVYEWILSNTSITNGTSEEKQAAIKAENAINAIIVKSFQTLGSVNSDKHTLTIVSGNENVNDNKVKSAYYSASNDISVAAAALPNNACITIKRGDKKILDNAKLK